VGVLLLALVVGVATTASSDARVGLAFSTLFAAPLPVLTAVYTRLPRVTGWATAG
jgi:hypothetical protein